MRLSSLLPVTARSKKGSSFLDMFCRVFDDALLSSDEVRRLTEVYGLDELIARFIEENRSGSRYADQEVGSSLHYPAEYKGAKKLGAQIKILADLLPGLNPEPNWAWYKAYGKVKTPHWIEGVFAVPSEVALKRLFHPKTNQAEAYRRSINLLAGKVAETRLFGGNFAKHAHEVLRTEHTKKMLDALWKFQGQPDIILLPAQVGIRHRGRSMDRACECFIGNEFGAGSLEGLAVLLTHPDRFVHWEQLYMDLPGDDLPCGLSPSLSFGDCRLKFQTKWRHSRDEFGGSMSCYLPFLKCL